MDQGTRKTSSEPRTRPSGFVWDHDPLAYHQCGLTGYTGVNAHSVAQLSVLPATRTQIGRRGLYKGALAVLPNGDLVGAACDLLEKGFPIHVFRSLDGGATWGKIERSPIHGKEPHLTCLRDGSLVLTVQDLYDAAQPVYHSEDGGHSWSITRMRAFDKTGASPDAPPEALGGRLEITRSPIEHPDGSLSLLRCWGLPESGDGTQGAKARSAPAPRCRAWLYRSTDSNGINTGWPTTRELPDGTLLTVYAIEPYHLEPWEKGTTVFQCVRWDPPPLLR